MALVAKTVKGWGAPSIQGNGWHGKPPTGDALKRAWQELDERASNSPAPVAGDSFTIEPPAEMPRQGARPNLRELPTLTETMKKMDMESLLQAGNIATRRAYGIAIRALGKVNNHRVVVLDADVSNSTFADTFRKDPAIAKRFIECKIAEQNMFSVGAGSPRRARSPSVRPSPSSSPAPTTRSRWPSTPAPTSRSSAATRASPSPPTAPARCRSPMSPGSAPSRR
jgi:transketolase